MDASEMTRLGLQPGFTPLVSEAEALTFFVQHEKDLERDIEQMNANWRVNKDRIDGAEARLKWVRRELAKRQAQAGN